MSIDFHQHVWTDEFRQALERRSQPPLLRGGELVLPRGGAFSVSAEAYSPEARLAELDAAGIDAAVVSLAPTTEPTAELAEIWNDSASAMAAASGGRLIPLAYRDARPGFAGAIVAAPELSALSSSEVLFARLESLEQILFVHPGPVSGLKPAGGRPASSTRRRCRRPTRAGLQTAHDVGLGSGSSSQCSPVAPRFRSSD